MAIMKTVMPVRCNGCTQNILNSEAFFVSPGVPSKKTTFDSYFCEECATKNWPYTTSAFSESVTYRAWPMDIRWPS